MLPELGTKTDIQDVLVTWKFNFQFIDRIVLTILRPAHAYTYPFEPKPDFSSFYAYAPEIRQYFEDFAKKYDLHKYVKINSKVTSAVWKEDEGICKFWQLQLIVEVA